MTKVLYLTLSSSSSGDEPPLVGGFGLPNDILPFCSILNTGYPIFNHLTKVFNIIMVRFFSTQSFHVGFAMQMCIS